RDWSSDVCSSDLVFEGAQHRVHPVQQRGGGLVDRDGHGGPPTPQRRTGPGVTARGTCLIVISAGGKGGRSHTAGCRVGRSGQVSPGATGRAEIGRAHV